MWKGPHAAGGIFTVETQHVDSGIERLALHRTLECRMVSAITLHQMCSLGHFPTLAAIETDDLVTQLEQEFHDTGADIAGSTDDTDSHACNTPR
jgi:hypothetical protein